jgi:hypothetical protein
MDRLSSVFITSALPAWVSERHRRDAARRGGYRSRFSVNLCSSVSRATAAVGDPSALRYESAASATLPEDPSGTPARSAEGDPAHADARART